MLPLQLFTPTFTVDFLQTYRVLFVKVGVGGLFDKVMVAVGESGLLQPLMVQTTE